MVVIPTATGPRADVCVAAVSYKASPTQVLWDHPPSAEGGGGGLGIESRPRSKESRSRISDVSLYRSRKNKIDPNFISSFVSSIFRSISFHRASFHRAIVSPPIHYTSNGNRRSKIRRFVVDVDRARFGEKDRARSSSLRIVSRQHQDCESHSSSSIRGRSETNSQMRKATIGGVASELCHRVVRRWKRHCLQHSKLRRKTFQIYRNVSIRRCSSRFTMMYSLQNDDDAICICLHVRLLDDRLFHLSNSGTRDVRS